MLQKMINCIVGVFLVCTEDLNYERLETHKYTYQFVWMYLTHIEIVCAIMNDVCSIKGVRAADMGGPRIRRL